jgi:hypothetical protein
MKYQLANHGWPIGDKVIPVGTIIDDRAEDDWSRLARGRTLPMNAVPLDQEAADALIRAYPYDQHVIQLGEFQRT